MAGSKISDYAVGGNNWTELLETIEKQRKGFIGISLTNYDNSSLPAIASGSYIEISGALYGFTSDEAISGSATSSSINYIYIDPTTVTASWTTTAPTWSTAKNGWYDAGQSYRYIGGCYYDGSNYTGKWIYTTGQLIREDNIEDDAVTTDKIINDAVDNNKLAANAVRDQHIYWENESAVSAHTISAGTSWTPTAGLYFLACPGATRGVAQLYSSGSWQSASDCHDGLYWSCGDAAKQRIYNGAANDAYYYYIKLQ